MKKGKKFGKIFLAGIIMSAITASTIVGSTQNSNEPSIRMISALEPQMKIVAVNEETDRTPKITVDEYKNKVEELNQKYEPMFELKKEVDTLRDKQFSYHVLKACYQEELRELCSELMGVNPSAMLQRRMPRLNNIRFNLVKFDNNEDNDNNANDLQKGTTGKIQLNSNNQQDKQYQRIPAPRPNNKSNASYNQGRQHIDNHKVVEQPSQKSQYQQIPAHKINNVNKNNNQSNNQYNNNIRGEHYNQGQNTHTINNKSNFNMSNSGINRTHQSNVQKTDRVSPMTEQNVHPSVRPILNNVKNRTTNNVNNNYDNDMNDR